LAFAAAFEAVAFLFGGFMTVANNYAVLKYEGNGSTTNFSFTWPVYQSDDVVVYQNVAGVETVVPDTNYSVSLTDSGGVVSFNTAPAVGTIIALTRSTPLSQETPYKTSSGFDAVVVEHDFDKQVMSLQEISKELEFCVKTNVTSDVDPDVLAAEVQRVYGSIDNVDAVADDISSVNAVAADLTNIDTVAGSISDVSAVAADISKVAAVADDLTNINAVSGDLSNIDTVAGIATDVSTVASNVANISAVKNNATNINAVAGDASNIDAVAGSLSNVNAVAGGLTNINAVKADLTNIDTVAGSISDVSAVAADISKVAAVADDLSNIDDLSDDLTNIDTVAGSISDVSAVAADISKVAAVADDLTNINAVSGDLSNINAVAADLTNIDAASTHAAHAEIWAEGTDVQVSALGGTHSAEGWASEAASIVSDCQTKSNLVTSVSSASTDQQYPSAKWAYDTIGDIETLINAL
jgi:hypothetical protein